MVYIVGMISVRLNFYQKVVRDVWMVESFVFF